ncbi:HEAT repeat domain-containing protein [Streptomyces syringium]|uniref:HEAT repeat domain-containing protein n=1 Tax=Streptomyces syringium TaxID=76729 RepID=UPI003D901C2D
MNEEFDLRAPTHQLLQSLTHRSSDFSAALEEVRRRGDLHDAVRQVLAEGSTEARILSLVAIQGTSSNSATAELAREALRDDSPKVRCRALSILADQRDEIAPREVITLLDDPDPEVQVQAIKVLASMEPIPIQLSRLFSAPEERKRITVIQVAAELPIRSLAAEMRTAVRDPSPRVRAAAVKALSRVVEGSEYELMEALHDTDEHVRLCALENLNLENLSANTRLIANMLSDPSPRIRIVALRTLEKTSHHSLCGELRPLLDDGTDTVRQAAMSALASAGCFEVSGDLHSIAMGTNSDRDRVAALDALLKFGQTYLSPLLHHALRDSSGRMRARAAEVAQGAAHMLLQDLTELVVKDPSANVRSAAVRSLAKCSTAALTPLSRALRFDPQKRVRVAAVHACASFADLAFPYLIWGLEDPDAQVRQAAVRKLHNLNPARSATHLLNLYEHEGNEKVRAEILDALIISGTVVEQPLQRIERARTLFDPGNTSRVMTTWSRDLTRYPDSPGLAFYNTGVVHELDQSSAEEPYRYEVDGDQLRIYLGEQLLDATSFSVTAENCIDAYGVAHDCFRLTITRGGHWIGLEGEPLHLFSFNPQ